MQEPLLYEYAVIRVVPRVEREEFLNVGLIVYCKRLKQIKTRFEVNEQKLACFSSEIDIAQLRLNLDSFVKIGAGLATGGPIARFEVAERFRWLTAVRSSMIQTSRPHPGLCQNLDVAFDTLYSELVSV